LSGDDFGIECPPDADPPDVPKVRNEFRQNEQNRPVSVLAQALLRPAFVRDGETVDLGSKLEKKFFGNGVVGASVAVFGMFLSLLLVVLVMTLTEQKLKEISTPAY
jgi:hypothetical protein